LPSRVDQSSPIIPIIKRSRRYGLPPKKESMKLGGARIPTLCKELEIDCRDLEGFLELEDLKY